MRVNTLCVLSGLVCGAIANFAPPLYGYEKRAPNATTCNVDQNSPPGDLTTCGNSTLFFVWRPKARFIAPEGWMNDPQGLFQRSDGSFHAGYQCHPQHYQWGNISQCSAFSDDLTYWRDANGWQNPKTLYPSQIYDIRGVFDGSIIANGWDGYPTTIYTSVFPAPLGVTSSPAERVGAETQSIAYTKDGGASWIKLNFGYGANPVIWDWPVQNLTGFRDPYAFESPILAKMLQGHTNATGDYFLTISGGIRTDADPSGGSRLFLYRQTNRNDVIHWTYLGPLVSTSASASFSDWSGNFGTNFETSGVTRLNEQGLAHDDGSDPRALNIVALGTEQGRNGSHENHWPLWAAATFHNSGSGVEASLDAVGVVDWGRVYASIYFPVSSTRSVLVGWTYEDDENLVLAAQRGYQGAFTLFRDLFLKVTRNVDPSTPGLNGPGNWKVWNETDGSTSVVTVGQKIVPETLREYRAKSRISTPSSRSLNGTSTQYVPFDTQPTSRHYAINANLRFEGTNGRLGMAGFRVLASDQEFTDIYYDPNGENLMIERTNSSLITTYGNDTETGKLRLWNITTGTRTARQTLNLTIIVDNSVVEVYANDETVITTRVYPWLSASKGAGFLIKGGGGDNSTLDYSTVYYSKLELWDGLINAWPQRPADTRKELLYDGPLPNGPWGVWSGV
ncbi:glycoside hydrolase family 32 protein [Serendipita vermifera MAFF 305830]|uniref:Glycoside hydrolase family 32 protein n=1 Tax=Serendipita vermifera MAFF 305830 TaxID=933852 RepID=A0A0C2WTK1_SERVB|nr:glycoside hydrolase family 32 protein [Serendipita vermifera MAFF 305830]